LKQWKEQKKNTDNQTNRNPLTILIAPQSLLTEAYGILNHTMATETKRKNIDLDADTFKGLSLLAVHEDKDLKNYIQDVLKEHVKNNIKPEMIKRLKK
jgi:hypothetical protein